MNVEELRSIGGIVPDALVKTEVKWTRDVPDGEPITYTFNVFVRRLAYGHYESIFFPATQNEADQPTERSKQAELIALAIGLGENGQERLTYEQAYQLHPGLAREFMRAITKVNFEVEKKPDARRGTVARAGAERDRGADDSGSEGEDVARGISMLDAVLPAEGNAEPDAQDGVGLRTAGDAGAQRSQHKQEGHD